MAGTRNTLRRMEGNLDESMGVRAVETKPRLSPVASAKDASRRPLRGVGQVDITMVVRDPDQPRKDFDEDEIARLAESIRDKGQFHPIRVHWEPQLEKWVIISGERRWRAARKAELTTINCQFHDGPLTESDVLEQQLIENLLREDLKPIEEARGFASLMRLNAWNGKQVAQALRIAESKVSRAVALLRLPEDLQQRVESGEISARSAYELSKLNSEEKQRQLADRVAAENLTHEQAAKAVRQRKGPRKKTASRAIRLNFPSENGWKITAQRASPSNYHELEAALVDALEEVRLRINNNVQLF